MLRELLRMLVENMESHNSLLWTEIERIAGQLVRIIGNSKAKIAAIEHELINHLASISHEDQKRLAAAKRIAAAAELRIKKINSYLQHASEADLERAVKIAQSPLVVANDSINKLISEQDMPPIEASKIHMTLESLLGKIAVTKQRVAF